jgi:hypothetical protein
VEGRHASRRKTEGRTERREEEQKKNLKEQ